MASRGLAALFVVGIAVACLGTLIGLDTGRVEGENRKMASPPVWDGPLKQVPRQIDAWFDDHFGFRNSLVSLHGGIGYALGVSSSKDVVVGREGWLFYAADRILESRLGVIPFTDDELRVWQAKLEERRDWLAERGICYLFMLAPEKSTLYPELLPARLQPAGAPTRADQLFAWLRAHSTVDALDVREALRTAKAQEPLYFRTDTHWNPAGAFVAYRQLAEWLREKYPAVRPLAPADLVRTTNVVADGDLAGMLALMPYLPEERVDLMPKTPSPCADRELTPSARALGTHLPRMFECPGGEIGSAVIVHDSFFLPMQSYFVRHFRRSTFLRAVVPADIIDEEKPDIVIEEMVERMLSRPGFVPASVLGERDQVGSR